MAPAEANTIAGQGRTGRSRLPLFDESSTLEFAGKSPFPPRRPPERIQSRGDAGARGAGRASAHHVARARVARFLRGRPAEGPGQRSGRQWTTPHDRSHTAPSSGIREGGDLARTVDVRSPAAQPGADDADEDSPEGSRGATTHRPTPAAAHTVFLPNISRRSHERSSRE